VIRLLARALYTPPHLSATVKSNRSPMTTFDFGVSVNGRPTLAWIQYTRLKPKEPFSANPISAVPNVRESGSRQFSIATSSLGVTHVCESLIYLLGESGPIFGSNRYWFEIESRNRDCYPC
jgi:hypothetical protein